MLCQLNVRNLAIVDNARIDFSDGLNVITGETGSGKSVLIGALSLLIGERADRGAIRSGASEASVEARFELPGHDAIDAILQEGGLPPCEDGVLIIRRTISTTAASRCWLNDSTTTLQTLRRLGTHLVDMHGPYDHQSLLSPDFQLSLLDAYGHCRELRAAYRAAYDQWQALQQERHELTRDSASIAQEIDHLRYDVDEIESAHLSDDDEEGLVARHAEAANAEAIIEIASAIDTALDSGEGSVQEALGATQRQLEELRHLLPEAKEWLAEARSAAVQVQELARTISGRIQRIEADPSALMELEARMGTVHKLKRKYGATIAAVLETLEQKRERLVELEGRNERLAGLDEAIAAALVELKARAAKLSKKRAKAAGELAKAITIELRDLGFEKSNFEVALSQRDPATSGCDLVSFRFAPNLGEPASALREIASSGEISRVMLATKRVLADHDEIPVLIFDEIDANVGGEIGVAVGRKLQSLAASHQVISITHLPQVAAFGRRHFAVSKRVSGQRTVAEIVPVESLEERARELGRMLGGSDMTRLTLEHAREMLLACGE